MKSYTITVNGNVYDVTVEENTGGAATGAAQKSAPKGSAPHPSPSPAPNPAPEAETAAGGISVEAGAAGKVVDIVVSPGADVSKGETLIILEVMKMETPVVAPADGTVASIEVAKGQAVAAGELLATLN